VYLKTWASEGFFSRGRTVVDFFRGWGLKVVKFVLPLETRKIAFLLITSKKNVKLQNPGGMSPLPMPTPPEMRYFCYY